MTSSPSDLSSLLPLAIARRAALIEQLEKEGTDCWRWFHGAVEGMPGLAIDRYGELVLVQLFRAADPLIDARMLAITVSLLLKDAGAIVVVDRRAGPAGVTVIGDRADSEFVVREAGLRALVTPRHRGQDPWFFLDLRAGRRKLRELVSGKSMLNLFAYTCTAGIAAARAGASLVWNVDFSAGWLELGRRVAALNGVGETRMRFLREDCFAVTRQLAGMQTSRRGRGPRCTPIEQRSFDVVFLDPPRLSHGPYGLVDVVNDYQSLFKPAWRATAEGGVLIATNNVASVDRDAWLTGLRRCAEKDERPIREIEVLEPDADFPTSDGRAPLKLAVCHK